MKGDYGSLVWVNDEEGKEFVCTVDKEHLKEKNMKSFRIGKKKLENVNQIVGTERWKFFPFSYPFTRKKL